MDANDIAREKGAEGLRKAFDAALASGPVTPNYTKSQTAVRLLTPAEFLKRSASSGTYLVQGLIKVGSVVAVGSRPGHGKTALLVELAGAVSGQRPFIGRETTKAAVAYFACEDSYDVAGRLVAAGGKDVMIPQSEIGLPLDKPREAEAVLTEVVRQLRKDAKDIPVLVIIDTLRAALENVSVLEDRTTSPALNMLRNFAERNNAVVAIANHTNRENPRATKGETLEAVAALELVLYPEEGDWHAIRVGKNRKGAGNRVIGKVKFKTASSGDDAVSVVDELVTCDHQTPRKASSSGRNQDLFRRAMDKAVREQFPPYQPINPDEKHEDACEEAEVFKIFAGMKPGAMDETIKKAFRRALEAAIAKGSIGRAKDVNDDSWLWNY